ncbi:hypothetical protein SFRURICE_012172, partial [Spodoptera frugiperda]
SCANYATLLWMRLASTNHIHRLFGTHSLALVMCAKDACYGCVLWMRAMNECYGWLPFYRYIAYSSCASSSHS